MAWHPRKFLFTGQCNNRLGGPGGRPLERTFMGLTAFNKARRAAAKKKEEAKGKKPEAPVKDQKQPSQKNSSKNKDSKSE